MPRDDSIFIRHLLLRTIIGLNDWERETEQDVLIDLEILFDLRAAGTSDDVEDTINYRTISKSIIAYVESSRHYLVEALATAIARLVIVEHGAGRVRVRVEKPGALRFAESVGVEIERTAEDFA